MVAVIDTNVLLVSVSDRSKYHWLYKAILEGKFAIAFTNDILVEYEEIIGQQWHPSVAADVIRTLLELSTAYKTEAYFHWNLIYYDADDNKFVDCAFASNADFLVTNDSDFNVLKRTTFPAINVVSVEEFKIILQEKGLLD